MNAEEFEKVANTARAILRVQAASSNPKIRDGGKVGKLCRIRAAPKVTP